MEPETAVAAVAAGLAAIISVTVPWMAFRLSLRQDQVRWLRERRADLYVDLLTEAYAEREWFAREIADRDTRWAGREFVDLRLPPLERAQLGSRMNLVASPRVIRLFNTVQYVGFTHTLPPPRDESERMKARVEMGWAFDALQDAIRGELGADVISIDVVRRDHEGPTGAVGPTPK